MKRTDSVGRACLVAFLAAGALAACAHSEKAAPPVGERAETAEKKADKADKPADLAPLEPNAPRKPGAPSDVPGVPPPQATPPPQPTPEPQQPQGGAAPSPGAPELHAAAVRSARREVAAAQRELDLAAGDCPGACRALASMERATRHLCDLAAADDERTQCEDAKAAVQKSRARLKSSCGTCPGGPSLERSAPIPSRP